MFGNQVLDYFVLGTLQVSLFVAVLALDALLLLGIGYVVYKVVKYLKGKMIEK